MHFSRCPHVLGTDVAPTEDTDGQKLTTGKTSRTEFASWTGSRDTLSIGPVLAKVVRPKICR